MNLCEMKPEEVDAIIKTKFMQQGRKGGKGGRTNAWTNEEIALRDAVIISYLTENQLSRYQTKEQIKARWGCCESTAKQYIYDAIKRFADSFKDDAAEMKKVYLEKLEKIANDALEDNQKDIALKALDMYSKAMGFNKEQKDINIAAETTINFRFDGE